MPFQGLRLPNSQMVLKGEGDPLIMLGVIGRSPYTSEREGQIPGRRSKRKVAGQVASTWLLEIASHDLRSPLAAIKAHSDNLLDGIHGEVRVEAKKRIRRIRRIARDSAEIVEEVLSVTGPVSRKRCTDLREALREAAASIRLRARHRGIRVEVRAPRELPSLPTPRALVKAAVRNLAENSLRASPREGRVRIEALRDRGWVRIEVKDRGSGKGHAWTEEGGPREHAGEGLGLRIVREIVELQGGRVFARPRPGGGMVVGFAIPCRTRRV